MSPKKNRKPLTDTLAQQFVYGEEPQETPNEPTEEKEPSEPPAENPSPPNSVIPSEGEEPAPERTPLSKLIAKGAKLPNNSKLMDKFQLPPKEATVRFTVDLPESMHRKLSLLAARTGKKKADIVRVLLDETLKDIEG